MHVNDFLIWKPPPDWLSFTKLAQSFKEKNSQLYKRRFGFINPSKMIVKNRIIRRQLTNTKATVKSVRENKDAIKRIDFRSTETSLRASHSLEQKSTTPLAR